MMLKLRISALLGASLLMTGCAGSRLWTIPTDLMQGDPEKIVGEAVAAGQLSALMEQAESQLFDTDEERMAQFLRSALASGQLSESQTETANWMLHDVCERNSPGSQAADFRFATPEASENTLLTYLPGKPVCVVFYSPDCNHCRDVIAGLGAELAGQVDVLAVCVDSTFKRWEQTREALPQGWVRGFDRSNITENDIYVVRSFPSIYLLDSDRKVVLKNPTPERLTELLRKEFAK